MRPRPQSRYLGQSTEKHKTIQAIKKSRSQPKTSARLIEMDRVHQNISKCMVGKKIDGGEGGDLFLHATNPQKVVKRIPFKNQKNLNSVLEEYRYALIMYKLGVGPRHSNITTCDRYLQFDMDTLDGNLKDFLEKPEKYGVTQKDIMSAYTQIKKILNTMHNVGLYHGDIHVKNFMFKKRANNTFKWYVIDFGQTHTSMNKQKMNPYSFMNRQSQWTPGKKELPINTMLNQLKTYKLTSKKEWNGGTKWGPLEPSRPLVHLGHARKHYKSHPMWSRAEKNHILYGT